MASDLKVWRNYISAWARIQEACIAVADADADDDAAYHRARVRFRKTLIECGWRPPHERKSKRGERLIKFQLTLWRNYNEGVGR